MSKSGYSGAKGNTSLGSGKGSAIGKYGIDGSGNGYAKGFRLSCGLIPATKSCVNPAIARYATLKREGRQAPYKTQNLTERYRHPMLRQRPFKARAYDSDRFLLDTQTRPQPFILGPPSAEFDEELRRRYRNQNHFCAK